MLFNEFMLFKSMQEVDEKLLPKQSFGDKIEEWAFKKDIILPYIHKREFKTRAKLGKEFQIGWKIPEGLKIISIGQSHIDTAWLWRANDTRVKKIPVTFGRALHHMNKYPDKNFTYTQNYAIYYDWMKKDRSDLWEGIKERVKDGKWEIVDGAWIENDCNIPCGESLIRQRITGNWFFLEEFGLISDIAWADDVFGFPSQLPQFLAKCNAKYFLTNKFCYNDTNKFPYHTMIWRGPDNSSELLMTWNQHKNNWHKYLPTFKELSILIKPNEEVVLNYMSDFDAIKPKIQDNVQPYIVNVYGAGDGGMGPRPGEIIQQLCWEKENFVKLGTMRYLFDTLEQYRNQLPIWQDELYLEKHRGCLTSVHMIKENNKTAEVLMHSIEYLNTLNILHGGKDYQPELFELWKPICFNQFHDILPGSSIIEVYRDSAKDYEQVFRNLFEIYNKITDNLTNKLNQNFHESENENENEMDIAVHNPLSWSRGGIISIPLKSLPITQFEEQQHLNIKISVTSSEDSSISYLCQIFKFPHFDINRELISGRNQVTGWDYLRNTDGSGALKSFNFPESKDQYLWIYIPESQPIPAFEYLNLKINVEENQTAKNIKNRESNQISHKSHESQESQDFNHPILLSNDKISLSIDPKTAHIISAQLTDHGNCIKSIGPIAYLDIEEQKERNEDAWNIYTKYLDNPVDLPPIEAIFYETKDEELIKSVLLKSKPSLKGTTYYFRIYLLTGDDQIYYEISTDYHDDHVMLKFRTEPLFDSEEMISGQQYGSIKRVTVPKNRFNNDQVKFEYPNQQWDSVAGNIEGKLWLITLVNRNKYGIFAKGSTMELSLLRSSRFRKWTDAATLDDDNPRAPFYDLGFHRLSVAIKIEPEKSLDQFNWKKGFEFNYPLVGLVFHQKSTTIEDCTLFEDITLPENIFLGTIKSAELPPQGINPHPEWFRPIDSTQKWIIMRFIEYYGRDTDVSCSFKSKYTIKKCFETDMLERKLSLLNGADKSIEPISQEGKQKIEFKIKPFEIKTIAIQL